MKNIKKLVLMIIIMISGIMTVVMINVFHLKDNEEIKLNGTTWVHSKPDPNDYVVVYPTYSVIDEFRDRIDNLEGEVKYLKIELGKRGILKEK